MDVSDINRHQNVRVSPSVGSMPSMMDGLRFEKEVE